MEWHRFPPTLLMLMAAPCVAQEPVPVPPPELLEFLGDWRPGEEVVLDDDAGVVAMPATPGDER